MTIKHNTYTFNRISALSGAGVLLILLSFLAFSNIALAKNKMEFISKSDTLLNIKISFENPTNKVLVFAKEDVKIIEPSIGKRFSSKRNYKSLDTNNSTGPNNLVIYAGNFKDVDVSVAGLSPATDYKIYCFEENKEKTKYENFDDFDLFTVAKSPEKSSYNILYKNTEHNEITINFRKGKGKKHLLVAKENSQAEEPINGTTFDAELEFGKGQKIGTDSYAIYDGDDTTLTIKNLKPNIEYHFRLYDYNGSGKKTSYNIEKVGGNPSAKRTLLKTPKALEPTEIKAEGFAPKWEKVELATSYELNVARDPDFKDMLTDYNKTDVGDIGEFFVDGLVKNTTYYYRVAAKNIKNSSKQSNIIKVITKD